MLWPDSAVPIQGRHAGWYAVAGGFVRRHELQPMLPYHPESALKPSHLPMPIGVIAPVAPVRRWASAGAPLLARVGYGGVLWAVDSLPDAGEGSWYAVSRVPDGPLLGWTPAPRWSSEALDRPEHDSLPPRTLTLDRARGILRAQEDGQEVLSAPAAAPVGAMRGVWPLSGASPTLTAGGWPGAAWGLRSDGPSLYGVHWHHQLEGVSEGPGWEVSPWVARWLYGWLPDGAPISVV